MHFLQTGLEVRVNQGNEDIGYTRPLIPNQSLLTCTTLGWRIAQTLLSSMPSQITRSSGLRLCEDKDNILESQIAGRFYLDQFWGLIELCSSPNLREQLPQPSRAYWSLLPFFLRVWMLPKVSSQDVIEHPKPFLNGGSLLLFHLMLPVFMKLGVITDIILLLLCTTLGISVSHLGIAKVMSTCHFCSSQFRVVWQTKSVLSCRI